MNNKQIQTLQTNIKDLINKIYEMETEIKYFRQQEQMMGLKISNKSSLSQVKHLTLRNNIVLVTKKLTSPAR